jgi:hypothetical protein
MNVMDNDQGTTIAGGAAGLALLASVQWSAIPHGEIVKVAAAIVFTLLGYFACKSGSNGKRP